MKIKGFFKNNLDNIIFSSFIVLVYIVIVSFSSKDINSDFFTHINHIIEINRGTNNYPSNFLFYLIINFLAFFSIDRLIQYTSLIFVLSMATILKFIITKAIISRFILKNHFTVKYKLASILSLISFFVFAIPDPILFLQKQQLYIGKIAPIVWHNSTSILLFPFVLLLFWKQLMVLMKMNNPSIKNIIMLMILVFINVFIKPSFVFVFIPVTFIFFLRNLLMKQNGFKFFILNICPLLFGFILICLVFIATYLFQYGSIQRETSKIGISLFFNYKLYFPMIYFPVVFFFSLSLPILTILFYRNILKYTPFLYALSLFIVSMIVSVLFIETGPRLYHGNFLWQNVYTSYLLFVTNIIFLYNSIVTNRKFTFKDTLLCLVLFLHFISGFIYLSKFIITHNYF